MTIKNHYIDLFRKNGFNCCPIPNNQKIADSRYQASRTVLDQDIKKNENFGVIPILGNGNCIIDIDDKERYRKFAEYMIEKGYLVVETGRGWHIPVIGINGHIQKVNLFDHSYQPNKQIIEIQGPNQYCVGAGSVVLHDKLEKTVTYENKGSDKIWDAKGKDFHAFVDELCIQCHVESSSAKNTGSYKYLRDQFAKGKIPNEKQSNNYFHEAARACLTDGNTRDEALDRIKIVYDKWTESKQFSHRPWSNIEAKVNEVYDDPDKFRVKQGRAKGSGQNLDRTKIAKELVENGDIYSNPTTHEIVQNKNGFLEPINDTLKKKLQNQYPEMESNDYNQILFKLEGFAPDFPETNLDLIRFADATFDTTTCKVVDTDEIADMGFNQFKYLKKTKANEPKEFLKFFNSYPKSEHPRLKAALRAIFSGRHDSRITVLHGRSRVGKTTLMSIICKLLGNEYAYSVDLDIFLEDRATMSEIIGKRLVVYQDLPESWKKLEPIKNVTGESQINIRQFNKKAEQTPNKIKIFATANQLPRIKDSQKDAMYAARLSLLHNIEKKQFKEDPKLESRIIENEGEKIISWIVNLSDKECGYEDRDTVKAEWEALANPQELWLDTEFTDSTDKDDKITVRSLCKLFEASNDLSMKISIEQMVASLKSMGYPVHDNVAKHIKQKPKPQNLNELRSAHTA